LLRTDTTVANAPDASGRSPLDPTTEKFLHQRVPAVVGHRSRVLMQEKFNASPGVAHAKGRALEPLAHIARHNTGDDVMNEGLAFAGPDHPVNIQRKINRQILKGRK
jgi:hypothetical protein